VIPFRYQEKKPPFGQFVFYDNISFQPSELIECIRRIQRCEVLIRDVRLLSYDMKFMPQTALEYRDGTPLLSQGKPIMAKIVKSRIDVTHPEFRDLAVHESVHAMHCFRKADINELNTEMTAYIAMGIYEIRTGRLGGYRIHWHAQTIADQFLRGRQPSELMMDGLRDALAADYGGIEKLWSKRPFVAVR
jgi:hypothetical protein